MQALPSSRDWLRRVPCRLSLRALMILVLVAGGGIGWVTMQRQKEAHRKWVIATIQAAGASIDYDGVGISRIVWHAGSINPAAFPQLPLTADQLDALGSCDLLKELVMVAGVMNDNGLNRLAHKDRLEKLYCFKPQITDASLKPLAGLTSLRSLELLRVPDLTDAALAHMAGLTNLEEITLSGAKINGSGLVHFAQMTRLQTLVMPGPELNDAGLAHLRRLTGLRRLYIGGGKYTDVGLENLSRLTGLKEVGLGSESCTDACLASLAGLTNLEILSLTGPQVTDAWLDRLAGMKSLRHVDLDGAQVSDAAIERLRKALPQVQISTNGRSL
jgi:Leucine-rich repeat (LRR) protein